ncbi:1,2-phenylacetyl-CoA epoxidase subunit PaaE [Micromonospora sp. NBC_01813]|uniref:1,2-phenylacetyl-CoA epoxidase subunit PaaE n=1 Tax=Micromonospora sp. NBC_01813 TaxID=2975988 RepID=UPI002DD944F5|nr:1,2-phenylacetyl-CoA epoxidase subunit PaaE [Micromonospora sp. NBC_01813]WSA07874.1 phenylacetate-CoA oxygenase/reductase subunit PaaK [Micromonospora sp. NBC_01813]
MAVTISRPARRRPVFHQLPVDDVDPLTDDAVAVTFAVPPHLREAYRFQAGQHLTVRLMDPAGGPQVRRSYSICSTPAELVDHGRLRIGVRHVVGGVFSGYAVRQLAAGSTVDVMPPLGHFTTAFAPDRSRHYGALAAGSGITPVLSLLATGLATEPGSRFTLILGNRSAHTVMFADEIADLKDRHPTRLQVVHVLSREVQEAELLTGRIDAVRFGQLLETVVPGDRVEEWFLCGPYGLVTAAQQVLAERGFAPDAVHTELFHAADAPAGDAPAAGSSAAGSTGSEPAAGVLDAGASTEVTGAEVTVLLDGRASTVRALPGERVLDAALRVRAELPYACKGGVCSTCRAKVVDGAVTMARNYALEPDELAAGYVLTCQSSPTTGRLTVDYDA